MPKKTQWTFQLHEMDYTIDLQCAERPRKLEFSSILSGCVVAGMDIFI
jgi:hypothetical protein